MESCFGLGMYVLLYHGCGGLFYRSAFSGYYETHAPWSYLILSPSPYQCVFHGSLVDMSYEWYNQQYQKYKDNPVPSSLLNRYAIRAKQGSSYYKRRVASVISGMAFHIINGMKARAHRKGLHEEDLMQYCMENAFAALQRWNPHSDTQFGTFVYQAMRLSLMRFINGYNDIKIPSSLYEQANMVYTGNKPMDEAVSALVSTEHEIPIVQRRIEAAIKVISAEREYDPEHMFNLHDQDTGWEDDFILWHDIMECMRDVKSPDHFRILYYAIACNMKMKDIPPLLERGLISPQRISIMFLSSVDHIAESLS